MLATCNSQLSGAESSSGESIFYTYDMYNRTTKVKSTVNGVADKTEYLYGDIYAGDRSTLLHGIKQNDVNRISYAYDDLIRLKTRTLNTTTPFVTEYSYLPGAGEYTTTTMLATVKNGSEELSYTYDELGNITEIRKNGTVYESYTYDSLNQLKTVTRGTDVWAYTYDNGGNLQSVTKNGTTVKTYGLEIPFGRTSSRHTTARRLPTTISEIHSPTVTVTPLPGRTADSLQALQKEVTPSPTSTTTAVSVHRKP